MRAEKQGQPTYWLPMLEGRSVPGFPPDRPSQRVGIGFVLHLPYSLIAYSLIAYSLTAYFQAQGDERAFGVPGALRRSGRSGRHAMRDQERKVAGRKEVFRRTAGRLSRQGQLSDERSEERWIYFWILFFLFVRS
jgi:hypothetical protein